MHPAMSGWVNLPPLTPMLFKLINENAFQLGRFKVLGMTKDLSVFLSAIVGKVNLDTLPTGESLGIQLTKKLNKINERLRH